MPGGRKQKLSSLCMHISEVELNHELAFIKMGKLSPTYMGRRKTVSLGKHNKLVKQVSKIFRNKLFELC